MTFGPCDGQPHGDSAPAPLIVKRQVCRRTRGSPDRRRSPATEPDALRDAIERIKLGHRFPLDEAGRSEPPLRGASVVLDATEHL